MAFCQHQLTTTHSSNGNSTTSGLNLLHPSTIHANIELLDSQYDVSLKAASGFDER